MVDTDYGGITFTHNTANDAWTIATADDTIGISVVVLDMAAGTQFTTDDAGNLVILGELTYRPVRFDQDGRVIVCERVS